MGKKLKSYVEAMRDFRGGRQQAAVVEAPRRRVRKKKSGRSAMSFVVGTKKNLTRTRKAVTVSNVIPRTSARESTMPRRATRRRSLAAKRRKRDRYGHFMELANPRKAKKRSSGKRTTKTVRRIAKRRGVRRAKTGKFRSLKRKRPGHHKHTVRSHLRRVAGRKTKVRVKRHRSHESAENPRKRIKRRKRPGHHKHTVRGHLRRVAGRKTKVRVKRHRSHEVAAENPRKRKRTKKRRTSLRRKRPGHHKHTVRGHYRKVPGRSKRTHVKRHRSHETIATEAPRKRRRRRARAREEIMAAVNPRKRAKRRRARAREEVVVYENPRKTHRRGKKRKGVRGRRRHTVRGHYRKPIRRRKATRSGKRRVHVKQHMSWEEQQKKNARARRRRRASARETVANPRKKRRAARRGASRASVPAVIRRRSRGRTRAMPGVIRIQIAGLSKRSSKRRGASKRRSSSKRRSAGKRHAGKRRSHSRAKKRRSGTVRRTPLSHRLPPASEFFANPRYGMMPYGQESNEYALENPLSGGELALAFVTGGIGFAVTDLLDRYIATAATPAAGTVPNIVAIDAAPGITRILAQAGLTALPFIGAYFVKKPMGRAALQGFGLGAGIHLVGQLIKSYVMAKALANNATGQRLYAEAIAANEAQAAGATGYTGATGAAALAAYQALAPAAGVSGLPFGLGATMGPQRHVVPQHMRRYMNVGPTAGVRGVGAAVAALAPSTAVLTNAPGGAPNMAPPSMSSFAPAPAPAPQPGGGGGGYGGGGGGYGGGGGGCNPCGPTTEYQTSTLLAQNMPVASAETMQATLDSAYRAAQAEVCGPGNPGQGYSGGNPAGPGSALAGPPAGLGAPPEPPAVIPGALGAPPNGVRIKTKFFASFPD